MLDRVRIQTLRDAGHTLEEIAAAVGVAKRSVQNILKEPRIKTPESAPTAQTSAPAHDPPAVSRA